MKSDKLTLSCDETKMIFSGKLATQELVKREEPMCSHSLPPAHPSTLLRLFDTEQEWHKNKLEHKLWELPPYE
jgi:hypothetical protein